MSIIETGGLKTLVGEASANDDADTSSTTANRDGSVLERLEHLIAKAGTEFSVVSNVTSSQIPNNTQTAGAITAAGSGQLLLTDILINTDSTGLAGPTNLEFSVDNTDGVTGAAAPIALEAISALGGNKTESKKDYTSHTLPMLIEDGSKVYIHGSDGAGTGGGVARVTLVFQRVDDGASIAAADLAP